MGGLDNTMPTGELSDVVARVKQNKKLSMAHLGDWIDEARENYDMVAGGGKQWSDEDRAKLEEQNRPVTEFNRLGTIVDAVSGSEVNNRQEVKFIPREVNDSGYTEVLTAAAHWARDNCDAEDEESDSFVDVLISGLGWTETRMDYEEDEQGRIITERVDPLQVRYDPAARKRNLADAKWLQHEKLYDIEEIEDRWPKKADEVSITSSETDDHHEPHIDDPKRYYEHGLIDGDGEKKGKVSVIRQQWYEIVCEYQVLDPFSGQMIKLPEEEYEVIAERTEQMGIKLQAAKMKKRVYKQCYVAGSVALESGDAPCQTGFTLQAITGKRDRNSGTWYGLVRPMKDPQKWANKFFSQILHIINTNAKGGILAEEGAFKNRKKAEKDWAKADSIIDLNPGGMAKIKDKPIPAFPNALSQMMDFSISSIRDSSGVNLELLGMVDRQQAGVLEAQRTRAGLTILAPFFDALRLYRKRQARVLAYFIQHYISDGRLVRIVGDEGEQFVPLVKQPDGLVYDVVVDSAPTARDMKERTWAAMMQLLPILQKQGIPIPPEVVKYAPLPESLTTKWHQMLVQAMNKPADPMQERMKQLEAAQRQADVEKTEADAEQSWAKTQSELAKVFQMIIQPAPQFPSPQFPAPTTVQ